MIISKELIAEKISAAMRDVEEVTGFPHELNTHVRKCCQMCFKPPECDLVELGVIMMYLQQSDEFKKIISCDIPPMMGEMFASVFIRRLCEFPEVQKEWDILTACSKK